MTHGSNFAKTTADIPACDGGTFGKGAGVLSHRSGDGLADTTTPVALFNALSTAIPAGTHVLYQVIQGPDGPTNAVVLVVA